jgi:DNA processing protein
MSVPRDLEPWLRLGLVPGLGAESFRRLLAAFGSPESVLSAPHSALSRCIGTPLASLICEGGADDALAAVSGWLEQPANHIITFADAAYPPLLLQTPAPPPVLYVKGQLRFLTQPSLAIVGSRSATPQGIATAESFAHALSDAGLTIVSGLAHGIDSAAHRGGLSGGAGSIAVVGTGLDIVYPARNRELAHQIAARGCLLSEFALGTPALAANFPRRNRLISGLSRGCLVVEAAAQSGSLITARLAADQGREVFAIPGSIHSPLSKGCHLLIKQGAKLVETAHDVLEELRLAPPSGVAPPSALELSTEMQALLDHLGLEPCDVDTLVARSGLSGGAVLALLSELEIAGHIALLPGGRYQRIR